MVVISLGTVVVGLPPGTAREVRSTPTVLFIRVAIPLAYSGGAWPIAAGSGAGITATGLISMHSDK